MSPSKEDVEAFLPSMISLTEELMKNPKLLHSPSYAFLKSFVEHFGGKIPEGDSQKEDEADMEWQSEESDVELDMTGVIEPDVDPPQEMGDTARQPTEEEIEKSQEKRSEAVAAFVEKDYQRAIDIYTEAILLNPQAALLYAKRGQIYLLMGKPNACIRDCDRALELNADSASAHKFRGRAHQLLGHFEKAAIDLRLACKFDFDEQADEWLREVTPNARKIEEHKKKRERKLFERAAKKSAGSKARSQESAKNESEASAENLFKNFNFNEPTMASIFSAMKNNPDLVDVITDLGKNPQNIKKHMTNPKVMEFMNSLGKGGGATKPEGETTETSEKAKETEETKNTSESEAAGGNPFGGFDKKTLLEMMPGIMNNPELMNAFMDVTSNPQNIKNYLSNPKVMEFLNSAMNSNNSEPKNEKAKPPKSAADDVELD